MENYQIPDPIPDPTNMSDEGYQAWVWAARYRPTSLSQVTGPENHFRELGERIREEFRRRLSMNPRLASYHWGHEEHEGDQARALQAMIDQIWDEVMSEIARVGAEVTEPAWEEGDDGWDPDALDPDWMDRWWEEIEGAPVDLIERMLADLEPGVVARLLKYRFGELE